MTGSASSDHVRAIIRCLETADRCKISQDLKIPIDGLAVRVENNDHIDGLVLKAGETRRAELLLPADVTIQLKCAQAADGSLVCKIQRIIPDPVPEPEAETDSADRTAEFDETYDGGGISIPPSMTKRMEV